ncbi:MAG TPA: HAD domain-containing protein [Noviherbaspirillum sp.]|nr:HAD domain-containing protein [Noviherbaspirillum sp.]
MILFLDIDGVLHPAICHRETDLLCHRLLLEDVLRACPHVDIVISSTWRESRTLAQLQALFSPDIGARIVGVTPQWQDLQDEASMGSYVRQAEIEAWLRQASRAWEPWVALDDQPWLFKPFLPHLVRSDPATGLTAEVCAALHAKLRSA